MDKIIIAEDDDAFRELQKIFISRSFPEYEIQTFPDGALLGGRLEEDVSDVRLIVTDNKMPEKTGLELIKEYALRREFDKIPFVLCYGGDDSIGKEAVENGAWGFVKKPVENWGKYFIRLHQAVDICKSN